MKEMVQSSVAFMVVVVGVWWIANMIATIASKRVMQEDDDDGEYSVGFTSAFKDMRWVELTVLQHFLGAVLAGIWLKVTGKSIWPAHARDHTVLVYIAALGNVVGNMSTNAAYALISSSTAQVIKACEPLFTFVLMLLLYKNYTALDFSTFLSVAIIVSGAGAFLMDDVTFNIWGIAAAMISNTAFPTRNIFLKKQKLSGIWDSPLQKFTVMSICSTLLALPLWLVKIVVVSGFSSAKLSDTLISGFFHSTYNLASITVLESVNPVTHAILNISKRLFVIMANILYFEIPFTLHMFLCLTVLLAGCYLYHQVKKNSTVLLKCFLLASFIVYLFIWPLPYPGVRYSSQLAITSNSRLPPIIVSPRAPGKCSKHGRISTAWIYNGPIPDGVLSNIEHLAEDNPGTPLYVYCGTTQCMEAVGKLSNALIRGEFAVLPTMLADLPLREWLAQHAFNKVIAGREFEHHLQEALALGILWKYGGFYINPRFRVTGMLSYPQCHNNTSAWVSEVCGDELFSGAYFSKGHPLIDGLAQAFIREYPTKRDKDTSFKFNFHTRALYLTNRWCPSCFTDLNNGVGFTTNDTAQSPSHSMDHFGTLSFERRVTRTRVVNLGDEVQGFPGLGFLPFCDMFLDRDNLVKYTARENVTTFMNAWWGDGKGSWPPPKTVHPIMVSIHLSAGMARNWGRHPNYLKKREPIGCRDSGTLDFLTKHGVKAYLSGCITLLMTSPFVDVKRNNIIYFVDLKEEYVKMLPPEIQRTGIMLEHGSENAYETDIYLRFTAAYNLMKKYGEAKLVITQRIHCALPCVAMNTPVIFFNSAGMPGGGGSSKAGSARTAGLTPLFHSVDFYKMSKAEAEGWISKFPWDNPPPNPNPSLMMRLRASSWNMIRQHQPLYDAGRKFGVIPMSPPIVGKQSHFVFHLVFTRGEESLDWRQWRSVEAIFYHHPTSKVIVHSNSLSQETFDVLTEASYQINVEGYNLEELLVALPADGLLQETSVSHKAELLCLLLLHKQGGVYLDTDAILVRPIDTLWTNILGWEDSANSTLSTTFMMFEKGHPYLRLCLKEFLQARGTTSSGSDIFTRVWHLYMNINSNTVHILPYPSFYTVIRSSGMARQCYEDTAGEIFDTSMSIAKTKAYAVKMNSKFLTPIGPGNVLTKGTVCSHLLSHYCVLCSNVY